MFTFAFALLIKMILAVRLCAAETGDGSNMYLWIALLLAGGCTAAAVTVKRRKHSS